MCQPRLWPRVVKPWKVTCEHFGFSSIAYSFMCKPMGRVNALQGMLIAWGELCPHSLNRRTRNKTQTQPLPLPTPRKLPPWCTRVLTHRFPRLLQPCLPWGLESSSCGRLPHQRWRTSGGRAASWLCWTLGSLGFANFPEQLLGTFCRALWSLPTPNTPSLEALPSPPRPSCCNSQVKFLWGTR